MLESPRPTRSGTTPTIEDALKRLIRRAIGDTPEIESLALGDDQGLPIIDATGGAIPVMRFTAMATMSLRSAKTAAGAVGLREPDYMVVHSEDGELVILDLRKASASLIARLRPGANLGLVLVVLRELGRQVAEALQR